MTRLVICVAAWLCLGQALQAAAGAPIPRLVQEFSGEYSVGVREISVWNDQIYFSAGVEGQPALWVSNGLPSGTRELIDLGPGEFDGYAHIIFSGVDAVYFHAIGTTPGHSGLYVTDGTAEGTERIALLALESEANPFGLFAITNWKGATYAACHDGETYRVIKSHGSAATTEILHEAANPDPFFWDHRGRVIPFAATDDQLFFPGYNNGNECNVYVTDGTAEGTRQVTDLGPQGFFDGLSSMAAVGDELYFIDLTANVDRSQIPVLRKTDGNQVTTVRPLPRSKKITVPSDLTAWNGKLYFLSEGTYPDKGAVWVSDGTFFGTRILAEALLQPFVIDRIEGPFRLFDLFGHLNFFYGGELAGNTWWQSDGTRQGTAHFFEPIQSPVSNLMYWQGEYWFTAHSDLLRSDGTATGTEAVSLPARIFPYYDPLRSDHLHTDDAIFVAADDENLASAIDLWGLYADENDNGQPDRYERLISAQLLEDLAALDLDDSGTLDLTEASNGSSDLDPELFDVLDLNDDGQLDTEELLVPSAPPCEEVAGCTLRAFYGAGDTLCLSVPCPVSPISTYQWYRDGVPLANDGAITGAQSRTLRIAPLVAGDSGSYTCEYQDLSKAMTSYQYTVAVYPEVPGPAGAALVLLAALVACGGGAVLRRRRA
ncbi:MAG: hypothetical protein GC168_14635 [Candidatus Hydrogenedens sp.]|nr:hypothetical protein [Candidatus Hydrogenedens sp.]